jgi:double-strand break repair protein AddB
MFDPQSDARLFGLAPGVDFPRALVDGLRARLAGQSPVAMAQVQLIVNTRRMQRRLRDLFDQGPPGLLPQIRLISELDGLCPLPPRAETAAPLRRRLELISLISQLLQQQPHLAPQTSLYALTDSLAELMEEMQDEGVPPETIAALDVTDQSGHWQNAQSFIKIAQDFLRRTSAEPDPAGQQRQIALDLIAHWQADPPAHPVILAGSTGSRGTTMMMMQAIAKLPQGAVVLPGFDFDMPVTVWSHLNDAMLSEDHPQFRFHKLMQSLDLGRRGVLPWHDAAPPSPARNKVLSLALRPAPVTHAWQTEGARLGDDLIAAMQGVTLVNAPSPRAEAQVIALRLRQAAKDGTAAALITPDRMLTRQVAAALDQWDILPDDSAGTPLHLSPPGRFLRQVAEVFLTRLDAQQLLSLLKHPLTHSGADRNIHVLNTQRLELAIRSHGLPYPDAAGITDLMAKVNDDDETRRWAAWVGGLLCDREAPGPRPLAEQCADHLALAEALAAGSTAAAPAPGTNNGNDDGAKTAANTDAGTGAHVGAGELWDKNAGQMAQAVMQDLTRNAPHGGPMAARDYADLLRALLAQQELRDRDAPHSGIMIWGTLEARVQGADLVILGGLNEGTWPQAPSPDPWLNRAMRNKAGLRLPERRIGLAAHDFQQAVAAPQVWITRAIRSDDAASVASRWVNRLCNLLGGLPDQGGPAALADMTRRGDDWLALLSAFEAVTEVPAAPRPSPRPPVAARPRRLSVTEIKTLARDPYAIYAKHILRLKKLGKLVQDPDGRTRGISVHDLLERFIRDTLADPGTLTKSHFMALAHEVLGDTTPWPAVRTGWLARLESIADWFISTETTRRTQATPAAFEDTAKGAYDFGDIGFTLTARADRIDRDDTGGLWLYDYKTGDPPSGKQEKHFDKQLLLEAAMLESGAFGNIAPAPVREASYIGLGNPPKIVPAPLDPDNPAKILIELRDLLGVYLTQDRGYTSRCAMEKVGYSNDFDHLARFGEWSESDDAQPMDLT